MNRMIVLFSLLFFLVVILFPPVYLQAENLRASNSPSFTKANPTTALNKQAINQDIVDIQGPVELPTPLPYLLYGLAALLIILIITLAIFALKRKKNKPPELPNPAELALAALKSAESRLQEKGAVFFAAEVSTILRRYIENSFMIPTTRQTTSEFFNQLKAAPVFGRRDISAHRKSLEECLSLCDLAKYARFLPENDATNSLTETARDFIRKTQKVEEQV